MTEDIDTSWLKPIEDRTKQLKKETEQIRQQSKDIQQMTKRNFAKELNHFIYNDPDYGDDVETICYPSLICIITELCDRIEKLEAKLSD